VSSNSGFSLVLPVTENTKIKKGEEHKEFAASWFSKEIAY
jgi:hypothetical protein